MKMLKNVIAAASLVLVSAQTLAFTPPYHINNAAIGKATIQSSGSCKINETYEGARWGSVYDSTDAKVGFGILSATGELLAVVADYQVISGVSDDATGKSSDVYFEDLDSAQTRAKIESLAGCTVSELISSAKAKGTYIADPSKNKNDFSLVYPFNGISPPLYRWEAGKTTNKAQTFSGKITFKGSYLL